MTDELDKDVIARLVELYRQDEKARVFLDQCAARERASAETSLDRIASMLVDTREEARVLAGKLEDIGCGYFIVGRRGFKSRFHWNYSLKSIGQAAAGSTVKLDPPEKDDEAEGMTIAEAKRQLSVSLGVPESAIEITIRA